MTDSEFWHNLANKFRALPEDATYADMTISSIVETIPPPTRRWMLHSNSHHVAQQFEILARRAGDAILPDNIFDSLQVWIGELHSYRVNVETRDLFKQSPDGELSTVVIETRVRIMDISQTSALLCGSKELRAFESERVARSVATRAEREEFLREQQAKTVLEAAEYQTDPTDDIKKLAAPSLEQSNLQRIESFMASVLAGGRKIEKKDIWTVAGYKEATEFERFQRGAKRTTRAARKVFNDILALAPEEFLRRLALRRNR